jgi:hypothetical protein
MKQSLLLLLLLAACPPPGGARGTGPSGNGAQGLNPDACGTINTTASGRKLYAFLVASAELDRATADLESSIRDACRKMAIDLGVSPDGDTRTVCNRASEELKANLSVSVKTEHQMVTRTTPPVCHTDVSLAADFAAECEGQARGSVKATCEGGTQTGNECNGYSSVDASAECKASAEVHASTHTTCTPGHVEVVQQDVTVVDATKWNKAQAAINDGIPELMLAGAKLELAGKAAVLWAQTAEQFGQSVGELAADLGAQAVCVAGQVAAVVAAVSSIQARFSVSVEVSAQFSASAGAQ